MDVKILRIKIRFARLFADPAIFDEPSTIAQRYLTSTGLHQEKSDFIQQITKEAIPMDDFGRPSVAAGEANYRYQGKSIKSEYMAGANLNLEYVDFGSELSPQDHKSRWAQGKWGELRFELKDLEQRQLNIELPDIGELYKMLDSRPEPTTMATIELGGVPGNVFQPTASFVETRFKKLVHLGGASVEVYASRELAAREKAALEKRLTRELGDASLLVILSKEKPEPAQ